MFGAKLMELYASLSGVDLFLLGVVFFFAWRLIRSKLFPPPPPPMPDPLPPPMKKQDFTLAQLKQYDGSSDLDMNRILIAVDGKVFDVTRAKHLYGKEKYPVVGRLLRPGDVAHKYESDSEESDTPKKDK